MASAKETKKKSLIQVLVLIVAVAVVAVAAIMFQNWWNSRPGPQPHEVTISASVGDDSIEVEPYWVCEPGEECPEGEVPQISVGEDETLHIEVPEAISSTQWRVLRIYDDPAANDETLHGANEANEVDVPGSVTPPRPENDDNETDAGDEELARLMVVEVSNVMIGTDDVGEEAPYSVIWSISTEYAQSQQAPVEMGAESGADEGANEN